MTNVRLIRVCRVIYIGINIWTVYYGYMPVNVLRYTSQSFLPELTSSPSTVECFMWCFVISFVAAGLNNSCLFMRWGCNRTCLVKQLTTSFSFGGFLMFVAFLLSYGTYLMLQQLACSLLLPGRKIPLKCPIFLCSDFCCFSSVSYT